ncbi:peptidylprolyl isomerase [Lutibacter sp.]|uniref:peptidylprolyl isomerase n=1 Tax=Lutibacter sp. TaxID=1925666 RepID=UPI0025C51FA9|nr:peptidylprolyl isomerase [Lutibacter sp.]MCF6181966.1 peptidylprolyl isomerase [Lutibacter sp.]
MKNIKFLIILSVLAIIVSCKPTKYTNLEDGLYANMNTNKGAILLKLTYDKTPITVANFVSLAKGTNKEVTDSLKGKPFYNGLLFHRVIKNFMIQGGDPTGIGEGGPGYSFKDEFPKDANGNLLLKHDKAGTLSMANGGPNTNGSQFFITYKATPWLDGKHSVFGYVVKGQNVVDSIAKNDTIKSVEIIKIGAAAKKFKAAKEFSKFYKNYAEELKIKQEKIQQAMDNTVAKINENMAKAQILPSGLKIAITETKNGETPKKGVKVKVNYAGYFTSGKLFDTNLKEVAKAYQVYNEARDKRHGYESFTTVYGPDAHLIAGFREGLQHMKIGDKAMLYIPSYLGYGEQGAGKVIPPNTDLVFELELVGLAKK